MWEHVIDMHLQMLDDLSKGGDVDTIVTSALTIKDELGAIRRDTLALKEEKLRTKRCMILRRTLPHMQLQLLRLDPLINENKRRLEYLKRQKNG